MHSILLYLESLPLVNVQFIFTKVHTPMYKLTTHSMSCIAIQCVCFVLLCYYAADFFSLFSAHIMTSCSIIFCSMSSKVISHTYISLSSDIFLDNLIIDIHLLSYLLVSASVMLA